MPDYLLRFGIWEPEFALCGPIVRDVENRRLLYLRPGQLCASPDRFPEGALTGEALAEVERIENLFCHVPGVIGDKSRLDSWSSTSWQICMTQLEAPPPPFPQYLLNLKET